MHEPQSRIRVAIAQTVPDIYLRHLPEDAEVVRYSLDGDDIHTVDVLVPPSFGPRAAEVVPRIRTRYIQTISAGVETIRPLVPQGVTLCNAQSVHDASTAEWAVTAILASLKWLPLYAQLHQHCQWISRDRADEEYDLIFGKPNDLGNIVLLEELTGKRVLIVGYGAIGAAIEQRLMPFAPAEIVRVARSARTISQGRIHGVESLDALIPHADIIVLMTPLTPETHHLFGEAQFACMRRGALLVNAARGAVVDTDALVAALQSRRVRAALDVTDPEPLPPDHPLWSAPGLLLTPHIAGSTPSFLHNVFRFIGIQLRRLLAGQEPLNIIRGEY